MSAILYLNHLIMTIRGPNNYTTRVFGQVVEQTSGSMAIVEYSLE